MGGNWHETVRGREEKAMKSVEMGGDGFNLCLRAAPLYQRYVIVQTFPIFRWTLLGNQEMESTMFYSFVV